MNFSLRTFFRIEPSTRLLNLFDSYDGRHEHRTLRCDINSLPLSHEVYDAIITPHSLRVSSLSPPPFSLSLVESKEGRKGETLRFYDIPTATYLTCLLRKTKEKFPRFRMHACMHAFSLTTGTGMIEKEKKLHSIQGYPVSHAHPSFFHSPIFLLGKRRFFFRFECAFR